jgi:hypothetical protein
VITIDEIRTFFDEATLEEGWDMEQPKVLSIDVIDKDPEKLEKLGNELEARGLIFVDIFQLGKEDSDEPSDEYAAQLDKIAVFSPDDVHAVIQEINEASAAHGIAEVTTWEMGELDEDEEDESGDIED